MFTNNTFGVIPPLGDDAAPGIRQAQRLAGTGTTEAVNSRELTKDRMHALVVGATAVRVSFRGANAGAAAVATTDMIVPANTVYPFLAFVGRDGAGAVAYGSVFVHIEAADGVAAYEAWVVQTER